MEDGGCGLDNRTKEKAPNLVNLIVSIFKMAAASGLAWELAKLGGSKHPYLAPLSVILCLQTTILQSVRFSFHRLLGTVLGVVLTAWAADYLPLNGWTLGLLLVFAAGIALLAERQEAVIHQIALSVLLVFALQKQSGHYAFDRIRDTFIGIAVGLAVHMLIFPPNLMKEAERTLYSLMSRLAQWFMETAAWVQSGCRGDRTAPLRSAAQTFQTELFQAEKEMEKALESLKLNPFAQSSRSLLTDNRSRITLIKRSAAYLERMENVFSEWSSVAAIPDAERKRWAIQLRSIGSYWSQRGRKPEDSSVPVPGSLSPQTALEEPLRFSAVLYTETSELLQELRQMP
jgi:uncharacterized membrane protein YgaE (UPF0421/DUF939 family)